METTKKKRVNRILMCIDMQNDFTSPNGNLSVQGAVGDVNRVSELLFSKNKFFRECMYTLDTHNVNHIVNCENWLRKEGHKFVPCEPFTVVTTDMVENGLVKPKVENISKEFLLTYIEACEKKNQSMVLWPKHCIFNTKGWDIDSVLTNAANKSNICQSFFYKGESDMTEFYSAIEPVMIIKGDYDAQINTELLKRLSKYDEIYICGEAMDYCVFETVKDIVKHEPKLAKRIVILEDCMSAIDSTKKASDIFSFIVENGGRIEKSTNI